MGQGGLAGAAAGQLLHLQRSGRLASFTFGLVWFGLVGAPQAGLVLEAPFHGATLFEACVFLRLCYRPCELSPADLAAMLGSLPGLLRLARELDAPRVHGLVRGCMAGAAWLPRRCWLLLSCHAPQGRTGATAGWLLPCLAGNAARVSHASTLQLMDWAVAADHCQLPELRLRCLGEVARRLPCVDSGLPDAFVDAALLAERCDRGVLAQLVALMARASIPSSVPEPAEAASALQAAANRGSFEWALERYSQQPCDVGDEVCSPWFSAAGRQWRLEVNPGGYSSTAEGHLSGARAG